jgi:hypothetical protein
VIGRGYVSAAKRKQFPPVIASSYGRERVKRAAGSLQPRSRRPRTRPPPELSNEYQAGEKVRDGLLNFGGALAPRPHEQVRFGAQGAIVLAFEPPQSSLKLRAHCRATYSGSCAGLVSLLIGLSSPPAFAAAPRTQSPLEFA